MPYIDKPANNLSSSESGDPFNFLIRNAHPEESGWYWCSSGDFESGQHVAVLVPTPLSTSPTTTSTPSPHSLHVDLSTTQESAPEQMGPLKVYNRFEAKWTERQVNEHNENTIKKMLIRLESSRSTRRWRRSLHATSPPSTGSWRTSTRGLAGWRGKQQICRNIANF